MEALRESQEDSFEGSVVEEEDGDGCGCGCLGGSGFFSVEKRSMNSCTAGSNFGSLGAGFCSAAVDLLSAGEEGFGGDGDAHSQPIV